LTHNQRFREFLESDSTCFKNWLLNCLPDTWLDNKLFRPWLAQCLGMRIGHRVSLRKGSFYGNVKNIRTRDHVSINREVFFDAFDKITIGSHVGIGFRVVFNTSTHEMGPSKARVGQVIGSPIVVEDGVWIGAGAYIGPGVTLGRGCVVSAGAVVMRSVEPNVVVAGSPARVIKRLEDNKEQEQAAPKLEPCNAG